MCWCSTKKKTKHLAIRPEKPGSGIRFYDPKKLKGISFGNETEDGLPREGEAPKPGVSLMLTQIKMLFTMKYLKTDFMPAEIRPNLFIGSIGAAFSKKTLKSLGITHIVCCLDKITAPYPKVLTIPCEFY